MRSPFPGMDPYLEQYWGDIHHRLIVYLSDALQKELPGDLRARVDERVFVEPDEGMPRGIVPDVRVVERGRQLHPRPRAGNGVATAEPLIVHMEQDEPVRQGFIEIIDIKSVSPGASEPATYGRFRTSHPLRVVSGINLTILDGSRCGSCVAFFSRPGSLPLLGRAVRQGTRSHTA
jgi:Protein of unknown function (DUF4058)